MSYGLKAANNKMAMARGAKFMKVHNLPGWYNTNGNMFGTSSRVSKEERQLRHKLKMIDAKLAVAGMTQNVAARNLYGPLVAQKFKMGVKPKVPSVPWTVARQSGIRIFNKSNLKNVLRAAIGPNSTGLGWAKYKNDFYPLIGTARPSGYVMNMSKRNAPVNYNIVVKGLKPYGSAARPIIPRIKL